MQTAECLNHLAPYLFAQIDAKKAALTEQGIDAVSYTHLSSLPSTTAW